MVSRDVTVSRWPHPPPAVPIPSRLPAERRHDGSDTPLLRDRRATKVQADRARGHARGGRSLDTRKISPDRLLPGVALVARRLLGRDVLVLETLVRPPLHAGAV